MRTMPRRTDRESRDLIEPEPPGPRKRRWGWWLVAGTVLVAAAVGVAITTDDSLGKVPGTLKLTGEAKTFTLEDVRAARPPVSLEALRGKPVVLNFFASWCGPCIREMPALQATAERYEGRVHVIGVTFND